MVLVIVPRGCGVTLTPTKKLESSVSITQQKSQGDTVTRRGDGRQNKSMRDEVEEMEENERWKEEGGCKSRNINKGTEGQRGKKDMGALSDGREAKGRRRRRVCR